MPTLTDERIALRPIATGDAPALRAIRATPEVAAWWGQPEPDFPLGDDPEAHRFTILVGGEVAGMVQFTEEADPDYRHAALDVFLDPRHHGRGLGTEALARVVRHLVEDRGHHRLTIDPAVDNAPAIRSYEKAGFRRVGVMRAAWRDPATGRWRDAFLMELVVPPPEPR